MSAAGLARSSYDHKDGPTEQDLATLPQISPDTTDFVLDLARKRVKANIDAHESNWNNGKCSREAYERGLNKWGRILSEIDELAQGGRLAA